MIENKEYFFLLVFLIVLPFFIKRILAGIRYFSNSKNFNFTFGFKAIFNLLLKTAVVILVIIALAGPLIPDKSATKMGYGMNTIFIVDVSKSMDCQDVKPSRLQYAKNLMNGVIKKSGFDKFGIVLFADKSIFYCPLTSDMDALKSFIDGITTDLIPSGGSSLKMGLQRAFQILKSKKIKGNTVLFSDGEDLEKDDLNDILNKYKANNIKVFTIGTGTKKGGGIPIYVKDFFIRKKIYKKYQGEKIITKLNETNLINIASATKGEYFKYDHISGLKLYKVLKRHSLVFKNKKLFYLTKNIYYRYLFIAFLLYIVSIVLMWL